MLSFIACKSNDLEPDIPVLVDQNATVETVALFKNLNKVRETHILFGHQDALAYGVKWIREPGRSDVKEVTGSFPAVYGWELGHLELGNEMNLDNVSFDQMRDWIRDGFGKGGIITLSWHPSNPVTGGGSWDVESSENVISKLLTGGSHNELFDVWLNRIADFIESLSFTKADGTIIPIPVIFRPWHEMNASFFWWGDAYSSRVEYQELYRYTVRFLRDKRKLNNILYAYSPNSLSEFNYDTEYWDWYPGDKYVDILGFDDYYTKWGGYGHENGVEKFTEYLVWLVRQAEERGKIPALTETGEKDVLVTTDWYTNQLLRAFTGHPDAQRIAYFLVWRNSNESEDRKNHFYVPFPGHVAEQDFIEFVNHPLIMMGKDIPDMYNNNHKK
jgi:mannan endo-1,4-beta-mannosidase